MPAAEGFQARRSYAHAEDGELYTTARLHLVKKQSPAEPVAPPENYAALAKLSDESREEGHRLRLDKWVFVLDKAGGKEMSHPELVAHIREKYKTPGWWTQMVAVATSAFAACARRARCAAARVGQQEQDDRRSLAKLYAAFSNARQRAKWLTESRSPCAAQRRTKQFASDGKTAHRLTPASTQKASRKLR